MNIQVEKICVPGAVDRLNEDALFFKQDARHILAAAIDGATSRLISAAQKPLLASKNLTGAALAAQVTRDVLEATQTEDLTPSERLLAANNRLAEMLTSVYGTLTPEAIATQEPGFDYDDLRYVRLLLPACMVTLIDFDLESHTLSYAHAGDTALFHFAANGAARRITANPMHQHEEYLFARLREIAQEKNIALDAAIRDPEIVRINLEGGVYHNYVDAAGHVDHDLGVGVVDGLPELSAYIQTGILTLAPGDAILICSDGFIWPQLWEDNAEMETVGYAEMGQRLGQGVSSYLTALRDFENGDDFLLRYPRFKRHDDATGITIKLIGA